jgi:AcrR family transcriptional regulator
MPRARNAIRRRLPKQERSRRLVDAVLEAARLVLTESGSDALTTVNVAQRAGVSVGSLYQYFSGRDALLFAIYEDEVARFQRRFRAWRKDSSELSPDERVREGIALTLTHYRRLAALEPAFFLANRGEILRALTLERARTAARERARGEALRSRAAARSEEAPAPPDVADFMLSRGIASLLDAALAHAPALLADPAFEAELGALASSYRSRQRG